MNAVQTVIDFDALAKIVGRPIEESDLVPFNWSQLRRGRLLSATEHAASIHVIRKANQQIQAELHPFDVFLTPTLTQPPRPLGYWDMNESDFDAYNAKWTDAAFMFAFNISGLPAVSVPAAWTDKNVSAVLVTRRQFSVLRPKLRKRALGSTVALTLALGDFGWGPGYYRPQKSSPPSASHHRVTSVMLTHDASSAH